MSAAAGFAAVGQTLGTFVSVYGAVEQGKAAEEAGRQNQAMAEETARQIEREGEEDARIQKIVSTKQIGSMRAQYGASGITTDGSPLDYIIESTMNAERDNLNIKLNTIERAKSARMGGAYALQQGQAAQRNYNLQALANGLSGSSRALSMASGG